MINLMFGANCPQFVKMLTLELERIQNDDKHEYIGTINDIIPIEIFI